MKPSVRLPPSPIASNDKLVIHPAFPTVESSLAYRSQRTVITDPTNKHDRILDFKLGEDQILLQHRFHRC